MKTRTLGLVALLALPGCASLHLREADSAGTKVAKGFARVPVAIMTLGWSEVWHERERTMESWLGHDESDLRMAWGAPQAVFEDGRGGQILVYAEDRQYVQPAQATTTTTATANAYNYGNQVHARGQAQSTTTYTPAQVYQWQVFRRFRVDASGRIVEYAWQGL